MYLTYHPIFLAQVAIKKAAPFRQFITHGFVLDESGRKMSKSLGNVIEPSAVIKGRKNDQAFPPRGPDVLRLWVAATDYTSDITIGPSVLEKVSEAQRKLRVTFRFALSNLYDFQRSEMIPLEQLEPVHNLLNFLPFKGSKNKKNTILIDQKARQICHLPPIPTSGKGSSVLQSAWLQAGFSGLYQLYFCGSLLLLLWFG